MPQTARICLPLLLLAGGCTESIGQIDGPDGPTELLTAVYIDGAFPGGDYGAAVLLSNSVVPCEYTELSDDPSEAELGWLSVQAAFFREDAVNVMLWLQDEPAPSDWLGGYAGLPEGGEGRGFLGWYMSVQEAALDDEDGIWRTYELTEYTVENSDAAGRAEISDQYTDEEGQALIAGSFDFGGSAISGDFVATSCGFEDDIVYLIYSMFLTFEDDGALEQFLD